MKEKEFTLFLSQLQSIAQNGLTYAKDPYDVERYQQIQAITAELIQQHTNLPEKKIPVYLEGDGGYATPKTDIRAVVFDTEKRLLLVHEKSDQCWSLPGGWGDIGYSPFEIAEKETEEEAGIPVKAVKLLAVKDKNKHPYPPALLYVYKFFILCQPESTAVAGGLETSEAAFFTRDEVMNLNLSLERNLLEDLLEFFDSDLSTFQTHCD